MPPAQQTPADTVRRMNNDEIEHAFRHAQDVPKAHMTQDQMEGWYFRAGVRAAEGRAGAGGDLREVIQKLWGKPGRV